MHGFPQEKLDQPKQALSLIAKGFQGVKYTLTSAINPKPLGGRSSASKPPTMTNSNLPTLVESQCDHYSESETNDDANWVAPKRILHLRVGARGRWVYALSDNYDLLESAAWQCGSTDKNATIKEARDRFGPIDGITT